MTAQQHKEGRSAHPDDLLAHVEQIIAHTEYAEEKDVTLRTWVARFVLELAKRAPKPRGRPAIHRWAKQREEIVIRAARRHKDDLIAKGVRKEQAADQAAQEASRQLAKDRNLAPTTIKRRMQRRR